MPLTDAPSPVWYLEGLHVHPTHCLSKLTHMQVMVRQVPLHRSKPQQRRPLTARLPSTQQKVCCPANSHKLPGYCPELCGSKALLCLLLACTCRCLPDKSRSSPLPISPCLDHSLCQSAHVLTLFACGCRVDHIRHLAESLGDSVQQKLSLPENVPNCCGDNPDCLQG